MSGTVVSWIQSNIGLDITGEWDRVVNLNVGGTLYESRRRVFGQWKEASAFCRIIYNGEAMKNPNGEQTVDRDGQSFRHVLNFLRSSKLMLPDNFTEWELLLDDASVYDLAALRDAIQDSPAYRRRVFRRSLPHAVYLRWDDRGLTTATSPTAPAPTSSSPPLAAAGGNAAGSVAGARGLSESGPSTVEGGAAAATAATVVLHPALPLLSTTVDGGLQHHGRRVVSVDEAVTVLVGEYGMRLLEWSRTPSQAGGQRVMHSIFFSLASD